MTSIFSPLRLGAITLSHRVVMAPLTRFRADEHAVHHELGAEYYEQRATSGGLLITEGTFISEEAGGHINVPGIFNDDQVAAWRKITDRVHKKGGFIFVQLWALGRAADPKFLRERGHTFKAPSAIPIDGKSTESPLEMTKDDIERYILAYAQAAKYSIAAGFDGVEIHNANGYLMDQFLQENSNKRTDEYGGSIENRARFTLRVVKAISEAIGQDRVGIRFSPWSRFQAMRMEDPIPTFSYITGKLRDLYPNMAYVHFIESQTAIDTGPTDENADFARAVWNAKGEKPFLSAGGYLHYLNAEETVEKKGGAVVIGRYFISNPDLVYRLKNKLPLNPYDRSTFYSRGPEASKGYTDYPFYREDQTPASL